MNASNPHQKRFQLLNTVFIIALLTTCLLTGMGTGEFLPAAEAAEGKVTIIHTNDMHSHFLGYGPNHEYTPLSTGDDLTVGGIARIAGKVNDIRTNRALDSTPVVLLDGGDFMMGSAFVLLRGEVELSLMDYMGYNAITIGNHEFDWKPVGTAQIYNNIPDLGLNVPVVASNLIFDDTSTGDDDLEALWNAGVIKPYHIEDLSNGLRVGYFGLLGKDADSVAPFASPVKFADQAASAMAIVTFLRMYEGVDLIVCLSHSGIDEDSELAALAPGIDVIISGHTHETTNTPIEVGDTIIVQADSYTRYLGILDLDVADSGISVENYELATIDDTIMGDAGAQALVDTLKTQVDAALAPLGYTFSGPVAETGFDLTAKPGKESNLGNLATDAMRWMVDQVEPSDPVDFAVESNGVIRDNILMGSNVNQNIAFSDAFRVLPLGFGLPPGPGQDGAVGYPMCTMYIYAHEVKKALEVLATVYPLEGSDYWLNISGLRVEYVPNGLLFNRVRRIYVGDDINGYSEAPLDTSETNPRLYKIAINYYVAQFIKVVGEYTFGILTIIPKDSAGNPIADLDDSRVDIDPDTPGIQELQQWVGFMEYFNEFDDTDGDGVPNVPAGRYAEPTGRIKEVSCFISAAAF